MVWLVAGSSLGGGGFLLLVLYLLFALLLQLFSLLIMLLVGLLSHLHCVFSHGPLCSLVFLVLWCSVYSDVYYFFYFCSVYHIFLNSPFFLKEVFPWILSRLSILEVINLVLFLTWGSSDVLFLFGFLFLSSLEVLCVSFLVSCSIYY